MSEHPIFARFYDRMTAGTERAGLGEMRRELLATARGRVLELGAGTGHNLPYYTSEVTELMMTEPDPHMASRLRERLVKDGTIANKPTVAVTPAEDLPFDDDSFDTVVATLVLCTVGNPQKALAEARRVLVEGGRLLFIEHVRSHLSAARLVAGPSGAALGILRRGLSSQPRDRPAAGGRGLLDRQHRAHQAAQGAADRQAADPRRRAASLARLTSPSPRSPPARGAGPRPSPTARSPPPQPGSTSLPSSPARNRSRTRP